MRSEPDPQRLAAWRSFLEAHARVTDILEEELEAERDLPLTWYDVLVQLEESADHRLRMTDLAGAVLLSKSGLTRLIDRMCGASLVERAPDPLDRRGTYVSLTTLGFDRLQDAAPVHMRGIEEHFARYLSDAETAAIHEGFRRILEGAHDRLR
jgi:DNA-binding MarR family transcriptional regulator